MSEQTVSDIMRTDVVTIRADASVRELAELLSEKKISGVPVVDDQQRVVGIASEGDLVSLDAEIHFPHYIQFLDSVIFVESVKKFDERIRKATAATVAEIMTSDVITVQPDTPVTRAATIMNDREVNRLPVVDGDVLVGIVTRADIVRSISEA